MLQRLITTKYITPGSHNLQIPTESEFHRYASNRIALSDFNTSYPDEFTISKVAAAIKWTLNNEKKRKNNQKNLNGGNKNAQIRK